jgi:hypothetical protein
MFSNVQNKLISTPTQIRNMLRTATDSLPKLQRVSSSGPPAPPLLPLERENAHPRDKRIVFYDTIEWEGTKWNHRYWIDGVTEGVKSVTAFTHDGFRPFDAEAKVKEMLTTSVLNPTSEYYNMTAAQIKSEWAAAGPAGTYMHRQIELYENGLPCDVSSKEMEMFFNFKRDYPQLKIWRTEMNLFCKELLVAGQADAIYRNENGDYEIYDWKRCKAIYPRGFCDCPGSFFRKEHRLDADGKPCKAFGTSERTRNMQDCNQTHYTIQLNIYRWLLKRFYGITAVRLVLVVLHPKQKNYKRIEMPIWENYVEELMRDRLRELHPEKFK